MTGWNLPPGVNVSDIPGNRPEDEAYEVFWNKVFERWSQEIPNHDPQDEFPEWLVKIVDWAYDEGKKEGYNEAQHEYLLPHDCDHKWREYEKFPGVWICKYCGEERKKDG